MKKYILLTLVMVFAVVIALAGCKKAEETTEMGQVQNEQAPATDQNAAPAPTGEAAPTDQGSTDGK